MAGSSVSNQTSGEPSEGSSHHVISRATFPIYVAHGVPGCRLKHLCFRIPNLQDRNPTPQDCELTYFLLRFDNAQTDIVTVLSSIIPASAGSGPKSYSPELWPHMPLDVNDEWNQALRDIVRGAVPDADPHISMQALLFYQVILASPEGQVYEYQTASALNFQIFTVAQPFPFHHAYAEVFAENLRVIVQAAGLSRPKFATVLESLIPVRGTDEILHAQFKEAGIER